MNVGIFFREGESWNEQRRFALRYLRDFGFGRRFDSFEKEIEIQLKQFIDIVKNGPIYEHEKVNKTHEMANIIILEPIESDNNCPSQKLSYFLSMQHVQ